VALVVHLVGVLVTVDLEGAVAEGGGEVLAQAGIDVQAITQGGDAGAHAHVLEGGGNGGGCEQGGGQGEGQHGEFVLGHAEFRFGGWWDARVHRVLATTPSGFLTSLSHHSPITAMHVTCSTAKEKAPPCGGAFPVTAPGGRGRIRRSGGVVWETGGHQGV